MKQHTSKDRLIIQLFQAGVDEENKAQIQLSIPFLSFFFEIGVQLPYKFVLVSAE